MNIGLYQSAASLSALERWQDAVAQNITSGQVTGYRKRTVEFSAVPGGQWQLDSSGQSGDEGNVTALFPKATNGVSFSTGETQPTNNELDVAIQGEGFFEVQQQNGAKAYTRDGQFSLRSDHVLVNGSNQEVLSESGSPIVLQPEGGKLTINADGTLVQTTPTGTAVVGKLAVQKFANNDDLMPIAGGVFVARQGATATQVAKPSLLQGYLESSNVAPLREMVNLVLISRAYDANQRVITNTDQQMEKTLDALG